MPCILKQLLRLRQPYLQQHFGSNHRSAPLEHVHSARERRSDVEDSHDLKEYRFRVWKMGITGPAAVSTAAVRDHSRKKVMAAAFRHCQRDI